MTRASLALLLAGLIGLSASSGTARAVEANAAQPQTVAPARPKPLYETQLTRLSQILGSVDYLRQLCGTTADEDWRGKMKAILDAEAGGEPERIRRLTAAFNRGYRSFASVYTGCTPAAVLAEDKYRREGATLAREIVAKYGN